MIRRLFAVLAILAGISGIAAAQEYRYVHTIFPASVKTSGVVYGSAPFLNSPYINEASTTVLNLVMDIYRPQGDTATLRPAIIFAHPGGFVTGNRTVDDMTAFCDTFARKGYVTATIDYRQGLEVLDNADLHYIRGAYRGIQDGRTAVRFLRANAAAYGIDPSRIYFDGSSAGAFIGLNSVYMDPNELPAEVGPVSYTAFATSYTGPDLGPPDTGANLSFSGTADGVMSCWGGVGDTLTLGANNPTPLFLIHGTADQTVPFTVGPPFGYAALADVYGSYPISRRLSHLGMPARDTYFVSGKDHEFYGTTNGMWSNGTGGNEYWDTVVRKATSFFWQLHKPAAAFGFETNGFSVQFTDQTPGATGWSWDFNDGTLSALQHPEHTYAAAGTYRVRLYVRNAIQSWDTVSSSVTVPSSTGIGSAGAAGFTLSPVPAHGSVTLSFTNGIPASVKIILYDITGRQQPVRTTPTSGGFVIDLSGFAKGIYFFRIDTGMERITRKLLVE